MPRPNKRRAAYLSSLAMGRAAIRKAKMEDNYSGSVEELVRTVLDDGELLEEGKRAAEIGEISDEERGEILNETDLYSMDYMDEE